MQHKRDNKDEQQYCCIGAWLLILVCWSLTPHEMDQSLQDTLQSDKVCMYVVHSARSANETTKTSNETVVLELGSLYWCVGVWLLTRWNWLAEFWLPW